MSKLSRRTVIASAAGVAAAPAAKAAKPAAKMSPTGGFTDAEMLRIVQRYVDFGVHATGGPGDIATGEWLEGELKKAGYATSRQAFDAPWFHAEEAEISTGGAKAPVTPQAHVVPTGPAGITAPLALLNPWSAPRKLDGAIAVVALPYARWSTMLSLKKQVQAMFDAGAAAVVLVTTGPSGEALSLNTPVDKPLFDRPVAILAPKHAAPILAAAEKGETGKLVVAGQGGRRPAWNLIGSNTRPHRHRLVLSTPRSGWFTCAGERGTGLAAWLALARWAAAQPNFATTVVCPSGHEYEYAGASAYLEAHAPSPKEVDLWIHIGANAAAREWQDTSPLTPLPSGDTQRVIMATPNILASTKAAFAGQPGLENVQPTGENAAGELVHVLKAGYPRVIGMFGAHRFHHAPNDGMQCIVPGPIRQVAEAYRQVIVETFKA